MSDRHGDHGLGPEPLYQRAWEFVIHYQGAQDRKGSTDPYTVHLRGAAQLVQQDREAAADEVVAAMLHDVVEDTPVGSGPNATVETVRERFGDRVAQIVEFCTDADPKPGERKEPWRQRKEAHFDHLTRADPGALRVVAADKTDNITGQIAKLEVAGGDPAAEAGVLGVFKGGFAGTLWYYRGMRAAMGAKLAGSPLYESLGELILRFSRLRAPGDAELAAEQRVRMVLDQNDPRKVGPVQVANGHYSIDAYELARRSHVPDAPDTEAVVELLASQWYGEETWSWEVTAAVADALRG
ncbi:MAG: HD domain-containing protein [Microthrixaceae bacterium]